MSSSWERPVNGLRTLFRLKKFRHIVKDRIGALAAVLCPIDGFVAKHADVGFHGMAYALSGGQSRGGDTANIGSDLSRLAASRMAATAISDSW